MSPHILILVILSLIKLDAYAQCAVNITNSSNPKWCGPCDGTAIAVSMGNAPFSYSWSTGDSNSSINNLCAGLCIITMTDSSGCTAIDTVTLTQPPAMTDSITTAPASCSTCYDGCITINLSGGCVPYTINTIPWDPWFTPCQVYPATYIIEICDYCGCCIQDTVTVDNMPLGINSILLEKNITGIVSPNPFTNTLTIEIETPNPATVHLSLYNVTGKEIIHIQKTHLPIGKHHQQFNTSQVTPGLYLLIANVNNQLHTFKILKLTP